MRYIQVCKALYDYEARTEEELTVQEDDILYVIEKEDDEWWKTELKQSNGEEPGPVGLVPAMYLEDVPPIGLVRAEFDYQAQQEEELSFEEGEEMELIENDDPDWYLVKMRNGEIGLAPSNYVVDAAEAATGGQEEESSAPIAATAAVAAVPVVTQPPVQPIKSHPTGAPRELILDEAQSWTVHEYDQAKKKKKKSKGNLLIGNGMICYGSETDKALPVQQYSILEVTKYLVDGKNLHLEIEGSKHAEYDFQAASKSEAKAILAKIGESTKAAQLAGTHVNTSSQISASAPVPPPVSQPIQQHVPPVVHAPPPPPEPEDPTPNCVPKWGISIYSFDAEGGEEMSVKENEQLYVVDYERTDGWWEVQKVDGEVGIIPSSYVQFDDEDDNATPAAAGSNVDDIRRKREQEERELQRRRLAEEREREDQKRREQEERERRFEEENSRREEEARRREEESRRRQQEEDRRRQVQEAAKRAEDERLRKVEEDYRRSDMERKASRSASRSGTVSRSNTVSKSHQDLPKPDPTKIRTWTDRSGTFKVEAQFIDFHNGKLRLHKLNGVKIDVPVEKMCAEDVRWVDQQQRRVSTPAPAAVQEPSEPILNRSNTLQSGQKKLNKRWDWFDWFMAIGIPMQASLQYASSFKGEKLDDSDISQLTHKQMKNLGLKEEHVRRIERFIETGVSEDPEEEMKKKEQLQKDEELARKLQNEWQSSDASPNAKPASRPRPPLSAPNAVHPDLLEFIGTQLGSSNSITTSPTPAPQQQQQPALTPIPSAVKAKEPEAAPQNNSRGFQDDAWTPRSDASPLPPAATPVKPMVPAQATPTPPLQPIQAAPTGPSPEEQLAIQKAEEERKRASEEQRKKLIEEEQIQKIQLMSLKKQAQEQQKQLEELQQLTQQQIGLQKQLAMQTGNQQKQQQQQQQMQQMQTQQIQLQQQLQQQPVLPQNVALQQQVQQQQQQLQNAPGRQRPTAPLRMATDPSLSQWQPNSINQQQTGFQPTAVSQPSAQQPLQTGYQNNTMGMQQPTWQAQQLQSQITGFPSQPTGFNPAANYQQPMATATVPVTSVLPQPLTPTAAIPRSQTLGPQPTGRHWNSATPDNPFGSPTPSTLAPQMTGVQFSTPNPQSFNPTVLQAQMTGQPSHSIFTPQGSMQYGQSAFPNNQRRW